MRFKPVSMGHGALRRKQAAGVLLFALSTVACSQTMKAPDITQAPTLYVVPYAHLDTQWRWEFPQTIGE
jgi:alpha-mannosidase